MDYKNNLGRWIQTGNKVVGQSLFVRLLLTYLSIFIITVALISIILTYVYSQFVYRDKQQLLNQSAQRINADVNDFYSKKISRDELDAAVNSVSYVIDSSIYALYINLAEIKKSGIKLENGLSDLISENDIIDMMNGKKIIRYPQYSSKYESDVVIAGYPLRTDNDIVGVVIILTPLNQMNYNIQSINMIIWAVSGIALLISGIAIYFSSRRILNPIHKMEIAARKLSRGENTEDIVINTSDEIGKLAISFNHMKNELVKTEKIRREFIANVSHELRTPLTSINGFVKGIREGLVKQADYDKVLEIVSNETQRLMKLTSEILELAKLQSGNIRLEREDIFIKKLVDNVHTTVKPQLGSKQITFESSCDEGLVLNCDSDRLTQILLNIVSNSIKYNNPGGFIKTSVLKEDDNVKFMVIDNGIGIPEDELDYIFDKFYQVNNTGKYKDGSGIGLNIVKALVELHGGTIRAESTPEQGTTIIFTIPDSGETNLQIDNKT